MSKQQISCGDALKVLSDAMKADDGYAWAWHCNLAMMAHDAGAPHKEANFRASDFMKSCFGVSTHHLIEKFLPQTKS